MKKSEELMLLLEYNKMKGTSYHLRKQLDFEISHPNTLLFDPSLEEIFTLKYAKNKAQYYLLKNPLMYHKSWPKEIQSVGQFYVQTKESNRVVTIDEIIENPAYKGIGLKRIMQDIFAKYIMEYDKAYLHMLKKLKKLYYLLPKNQLLLAKKFRKKLLSSMIIFLVILGVYFIPYQSIIVDFFGYQTVINMFENPSMILNITNTIGRFTLAVIIIFFFIYYMFRSTLKKIHNIELVHRNFDEDIVLENHQIHIDKLILNIQLFISKIEDEHKGNFSLLDSLDYEQNDVKNYQENLAKTHQNNDVFQKNKSLYFYALNVSYYLALILSSVFLISLIIHGVINHV